MKEKFDNTPAGDMWLIFKHTPSGENTRDFVKAMQELDKSRSQDIEM